MAASSVHLKWSDLSLFFSFPLYFLVSFKNDWTLLNVRPDSPASRGCFVPRPCRSLCCPTSWREGAEPGPARVTTESLFLHIYVTLAYLSLRCSGAKSSGPACSSPGPGRARPRLARAGLARLLPAGHGSSRAGLLLLHGSSGPPGPRWPGAGIGLWPRASASLTMS